MAPRRQSKSKPEVRARLRQQIQAQNAAVRRRGQTRQAMERSGRGLPPAGGTGGNTNRARDQRRATARRVQVGQQATVARAWNRVAAANDRQASIRSELKMTDGRVRYAPPKGEHYGGQPKLPPSNQQALPPGRQGGAIRPGGGAALANRSDSSSAATPPASNARGPRPGGRVVVNETPRLPPAGGSRGGAMAQRGGGAIQGSGGPVRQASVREVGPSQGRMGGNSGRPGLPSGGRGGALVRAGGSGGGGGAAAAVGKVAGAARGGFPIGAALAIPFAAADVVRQTQRTGAAFNRMVADTRAQSYSPSGAGGRGAARSAPSNGNRQTASRGGTQPVDRFTPRTASKPTPQGPSRPPGGTNPPRGGQRPLPAPVSRPSGGTSTRSASASPAKAVDSSTDSWSINFLRSRRGLPSLAKASRGAEEPNTNPGDLGSRAQGEGGYSLTDEDKKRQRKG